MAIVRIVPGACGMHTRIEAQADEGYQVTVTITTDCEHVQQLAAELGELSAMDELMRPITETTPYKLAARYWFHASCPVPGAIIESGRGGGGYGAPHGRAYSGAAGLSVVGGPPGALPERVWLCRSTCIFWCSRTERLRVSRPAPYPSGYGFADRRPYSRRTRLTSIA